MLMGNILYFAYSVISIAITSMMAYLFWKRRSTTGAPAISLVMLAAVEWSTCQLLSGLSSSLEMKIFFDNLTFPGVTAIPVLLFIFCIQYTRRDKLLKAMHYSLLSIIPILTLIAVFTSRWHRFFAVNARTEPLADTGISLLVYDYGGWFWIHSGYSFILILLGVIILLQRLVNLSGVYRKQALMILAAILIPLIGSLLYLLGLGPARDLDTTTFSFTFSGILLFIGMFKYKMLDLVPIAYEAVISAMEDAVIVLDTQNRIIDLNNSAEAVFSETRNNLIGQPLSLLFREEDSLCSDIISSLKASGKFELHKGGIKRCYNMKISPILDKNKAAIGRFLLLNDITELEKAMEELRTAKTAAENASKAKSEFLATMSHEIRTPINGIIGMAELLEDAALSTQERENLSTLQYSADSLLNIINEILDYSKIEAGKMQVESVNFNLRELIYNMAKTFSYNKKLGAIRFTYQIEEAVPEVISGDFVKLRQILVNLLSNAFKFTEEGRIEVSVGLINNSDTEAFLGFTVSDTGIGIPEDKISGLFESFHQLDSSTTRKYGGTGLGLSIVKKLLVLMGGSIRVESKVDAGSSFTFRLPLIPVADTTSAEIVKAAYTCSFDKNLRILVAEDSKVNQLVLLQFLKKKPWKTDVAQNGREALERYLKGSYDIILMDIQMPELDGYEVAKAIRVLEASTGRHIPIVALTANATEADRNMCLLSGMDDFLSKPIKSEILYECIQKNCHS
ncbi:MAG: histidine kinase N-terminal 7TM domain-containing protein [Bacillota bacterium]|nr:histidine kinase N-terminal 7TM domain-containing protein [Bacillota bacterium]